MKFFQPQIQLVREESVTSLHAYSLHIVTFCPLTNYRADGYEVDDTELNTEGLYKVTIKLRQDPSLPDFKYITPVVHTISLGGIAFPGGEGWIQVIVEGAVLDDPSNSRNSANPTTTTKTGGTGTVSTTDADDKPRPMDMDKL